MGFLGTSATRGLEDIPGGELVTAGLLDLAAGRESVAALLVASFADRLRLLGLRVPEQRAASPEMRLYLLLQQELGDGAHSRYNALIQRVSSFTHSYRRCAR